MPNLRGRDAADLFARRRHVVGGHVGDAAIGAGIPRVQVQCFVLDPAAITQAQLQCRYADNPVGRRT